MVEDQKALEFYDNLTIDGHDNKINVYKVINKDLVNNDIYFILGNYCVKWKNIFKLNMEPLTEIINIMDEQIDIKFD